MRPFIEFTDVSKVFTTPQGTLTILDHATFSIQQHEKVALVGPSGSGKTTALMLLAGLDVPTEGSVRVGELTVSGAREDELARYRNTTIGIVFQSFELISPFTVHENVAAPLDIRGTRDHERVLSLIERVSLAERTSAFPRTLSGGEKQRVAIARALAHNPELILADEPTGSLDRATGERVLSLLLHEVEREHKTLILITHDEQIASRMDRVLVLQEGTVRERTSP